MDGTWKDTCKDCVLEKMKRKKQGGNRRAVKKTLSC